MLPIGMDLACTCTTGEHDQGMDLKNCERTSTARIPAAAVR